MSKIIKPLNADGKRTVFVLHAFLAHSLHGVSGERSDEAWLEETVDLVRACGLCPVKKEIIHIKKPHPAFLMGRGQLENLGEKIADAHIETLVINCDLSAIQQRNIEKHLKICVIDRTRLILEIFARRAKSHEGRLQVELAALNWQKPRLVKSWDHLERQRGGGGFLSGPGERQLEIDKRLIHQQILRVRNSLSKVKKTRHLQRKNRSYPLIALIGYTNAGKSTLFSRLTENPNQGCAQLFASLDTSLKMASLSKGRHFLFSDTVGFVSALPTLLVNAFHATLEELRHADVILHVRDISARDSQAQQQDVLNVIKQILGDHIQQGTLSSGTAAKPTIIEIWNKADQLDHKHYQSLKKLAHKQDCFLISALHDRGIGRLKEKITVYFSSQDTLYEILLPHHYHAARAFLYKNSVIEQNHLQSEYHLMRVRLSCKQAGRFSKYFNLELNVIEKPIVTNGDAYSKKSETRLSLPEYWQPLQ